MYDIYGKEGLSAGLEVGNTVKGTDELRREWEGFKAQQVRTLTCCTCMASNHGQNC